MKSIAFTAVAVLALAGCAQNQQSVAPVAPAPLAQAPAAKAYNVAKPKSDVWKTAKGTFVGHGKFTTTGSAVVFRDATGWKVKLGPDFNYSGAPDPKVGLGRNGYITGTTLGHLTSASGEQVYALPAGLDIGDYDQVWIWCEKFSVPIGHADLTLL